MVRLDRGNYVCSLCLSERYGSPLDTKVIDDTVFMMCNRCSWSDKIGPWSYPEHVAGRHTTPQEMEFYKTVARRQSEVVQFLLDNMVQPPTVMPQRAPTYEEHIRSRLDAEERCAIYQLPRSRPQFRLESIKLSFTSKCMLYTTWSMILGLVGKHFFG